VSPQQKAWIKFVWFVASRARSESVMRFVANVLLVPKERHHTA